MEKRRLNYIRKLNKMSDNITIKRIATLHPKLRSECAEIVASINNAGVGLRITQAYRTFDEQKALYDKYVKGGPKAAPPGLSYHNYGLAIDFCLLHTDGSISFNMSEDMDKDKKADWMEVVNAFTAKGWKWGASFKDNDHLEKSFSYDIHILQTMKKDKDGYPMI